MKTLLKKITLTLTLLLTTTTFASIAETYGTNAKTMGMLGGGGATMGGVPAVYYNVAGLGRSLFSPGNKQRSSVKPVRPVKVLDKTGRKIRIKKDKKTNNYQSGHAASSASSNNGIIHQFQIGYIYGLGSLLETNFNPGTLENPAVSDTSDYAISLGLVLDLNAFADLGRSIKFGFSMILPGNGNLIEIDDVSPASHKYLNFGRSNRGLSINAGLGGEILKDQLFFGLGANIIAGGNGAMVLKEIDISPSVVVPEQQAKVTLQPVVSPTVGLQYHFRQFNFGLSYNHEVVLDMGPIIAQAETKLAGIQLQMDIGISDLYSPSKATFSFDYQVIQKLKMSLDVSMYLWKNYTLSRVRVAYYEPINFRNTFYPRLGAVYNLLKELDLYGALGYQMSPVQHRDGQLNIMDGDRYLASMGARYRLDKIAKMRFPINFDLSFQYQYMPVIAVTKADPTQSYKFGGSIIAVAFSVTNYF